MPIKWSALEVAEAMDELENFLTYAEKDLAQAEAKAIEATRIPYLPQYMGDRLRRLIYTIQARDRIRDAIQAVRNSIPQDAIRVERQAGKQQSLELEVKPCQIEKHDDFLEALNKGIKL